MVATLHPIHVLLVEDNPGDADLVRDTLEAGSVPLEVSVAVDGAEAVERLHRRPPFADATLPDLILLDLNLPKLDGHRVLAEIKRDVGLRHIPVVVLSSSDANTDVAASYALGACCYVTKPVGLDAFQATVRSVETFWLTVATLR